MALLEAKSLKKTFDGITALKDGSLSCEEGMVCGLLGANGSGKSTFSKIISGILKPCSGEILFDGNNIFLQSPLDAKKCGIAMVHQNLSLIPNLSVWENINLGHEPTDAAGQLDDKKAIQIAEKVIAKVCPGLSIYEKAENLSPSHKQLVEIAKALSHNPRLLILDEPTASLENNQVENLIKIIEELKKNKVAIIFISHRLWEVVRICDFIVVFRNGETVGSIDFVKEGRNESKIVSMITGNESTSCNNYNRVRITVNENILKVENFSVKGKVKNVNLAVKSGEIIGITGLQGQGQEELLLALSGLLPSKGRTFINGEEVVLKHPRDAIRKGMVLVPGDRHKEGLFLQHDILTNLIYPRLSLKRKSLFLNFKALIKESREIVNSISINPPNLNKIVKYLSGGNQQKVVVGKWLMHSPRVLILDDPAKGVDIEAKKELYRVVANLAENGTGVILYASDNEELICFCDRVLVMFEGEIVDEIEGSEMSDERLTASALRTNYSKSSYQKINLNANAGEKVI